MTPHDVHDVAAQPGWTPWLRLEDVAVPMAVDTDQTISDLGDTLIRLHELH
jgi:hypothetical protein